MTATDPSVATHSPPTREADKIAALHRRWMLEGWEKKPGDGPWGFRDKLGEFYDWSGGRLALHDTFDPQHRWAAAPPTTPRCSSHLSRPCARRFTP